METFFRQEDGAWLFNPWKGHNIAAVLRSIDVSLPLTEIYSGIEFTGATS